MCLYLSKEIGITKEDLPDMLHRKFDEWINEKPSPEIFGAHYVHHFVFNVHCVF